MNQIKIAKGEKRVKNGVMMPCGCIHYISPPNRFYLCNEHNYTVFKDFMVRGCKAKGLRIPVFE